MYSFSIRLFLPIFLVVSSSSCTKSLSPEQKALDLAKKYVMQNGLSAEKTIYKMIKDGGNDIKPIGWDVEEIGDQVFLVKYRYTLHSFEKGIGERGYFFRVDLNNVIVANVTEKYIKRMAPLSKPYKNEEEIAKSLVDNSGGM